jgi:hypothetical protein
LIQEASSKYSENIPPAVKFSTQLASDNPTQIGRLPGIREVCFGPSNINEDPISLLMDTPAPSPHADNLDEWISTDRRNQLRLFHQKFSIFKNFMKLPPELRIEIWKSTLPAPRIVEVYTPPCGAWKTGDKKEKKTKVVPALYHVHQESRNLGFVTFVKNPAGRPYWINPRSDTISFWLYTSTLANTDTSILLSQIKAIAEHSRRLENADLGVRHLLLNFADHGLGLEAQVKFVHLINIANEIKGLQVLRFINRLFEPLDYCLLSTPEYLDIKLIAFECFRSALGLSTSTLVEVSLRDDYLEYIFRNTLWPRNEMIKYWQNCLAGKVTFEDDLP